MSLNSHHSNRSTCTGRIFSQIFLGADKKICGQHVFGGRAILCVRNSMCEQGKTLTFTRVFAWLLPGSSALNRGHEHHRSIRRCRICEGRPRRFGGVQRGGGTWNANSARTVQQWSVIPAAMAGVRLVAAMPVAWAARWRLA